MKMQNLSSALVVLALAAETQSQYTYSYPNVQQRQPVGGDTAGYFRPIATRPQPFGSSSGSYMPSSPAMASSTQNQNTRIAQSGNLCYQNVINCADGLVCKPLSGSSKLGRCTGGWTPAIQYTSSATGVSSGSGVATSGIFTPSMSNSGMASSGMASSGMASSGMSSSGVVSSGMASSATMPSSLVTPISSYSQAATPSSMGSYSQAVIPSSMANPFAQQTQAASQFPAGGRTQIYFGLGCFWESQYVTARMEMDCALPALEPKTPCIPWGRQPVDATARTGYAGGTMPGVACYDPNPMTGPKYADKGHTEVTAVYLDNDSIEAQFSGLMEEYFGLFKATPYGMARPDQQMDIGSGYRNGVFIPGGVRSSLFRIVKGKNKYNMPLVEGFGNEQDKFGTVYIYDSNRFPFHEAEMYHQFHSNFFGMQYHPAYVWGLYNLQQQAGKLRPHPTCPEGREHK